MQKLFTLKILHQKIYKRSGMKKKTLQRNDICTLYDVQSPNVYRKIFIVQKKTSKRAQKSIVFSRVNIKKKKRSQSYIVSVMYLFILLT